MLKKKSYGNPCSDCQIHPLKSRITARQRANPGQSLQRFPSLPPEIKNHCTQEVVNGHNRAAIPKFTPSIQESLQRQSQNAGNLCSDCQIHPLKSGIAARQRANPGQSLQRLPSLPPEIRNHCTQQGINRENRAAIPKLTP